MLLFVHFHFATYISNNIPFQHSLKRKNYTLEECASVSAEAEIGDVREGFASRHRKTLKNFTILFLIIKHKPMHAWIFFVVIL